MPPAPDEYHGTAAVREFLLSSAMWRTGRRFRLVPMGANAQPAFGWYLAEFGGLIVLTVRNHRIAGVTRFHDGELARAFGLEPAGMVCA